MDGTLTQTGMTVVSDLTNPQADTVYFRYRPKYAVRARAFGKPPGSANVTAVTASSASVRFAF